MDECAILVHSLRRESCQTLGGGIKRAWISENLQKVMWLMGRVSDDGGKCDAANCAPRHKDTLAERLRRRPAKLMGSPRVGSNPTGDVLRW